MRRDEGFTLIELLLAVTLLSMIAVLMSSGLRLGGRVWEGSYEKQQAWMDHSLAYQFLRGRFEAALPIILDAPASAKPMAFSGSPNEVSFINADLSRVGFLGDQVLNIVIQKLEADTQLAVRRSTFVGKFPVNEPEEDLILATNIGEAKFQFFGSVDGRQPSVWMSDWHDHPRWPTLIRLEIWEKAKPERIVNWIFAMPAAYGLD